MTFVNLFTRLEIRNQQLTQLNTIIFCAETTFAIIDGVGQQALRREDNN